eukprot:PhM_4_TR1289/c1_g1_i5/m.7441
MHPWTRLSSRSTLGALIVLRYCSAAALLNDGNYPQILVLVVDYGLVTDMMSRADVMLGNQPLGKRFETRGLIIFDAESVTKAQKEFYATSIVKGKRLVSLFL